MARDYSPTHFFLRVPNHLLGRFFRERHGVLQEVDFTKLDENRGAAEMIFQTVLGLDDAKQAQIEAECQEVEGMAFHGGVTALIEEATNFPHHDQTFPEAINQFDGDHAKAMWTYLEHPRYWLAATSILHAQNIADSFWKRRSDLPHLVPMVEQADADRLGDALRSYFRNKEGRGRHSKVDIFRRRDKEYFFAYLSNFGQSDAEWEGNTLAMRARLPAFEAIFVYSQFEGTLDIYAPGNTKYMGDLQKIFAKIILTLDDLHDFAGSEEVYNLDPLGERDFVFISPENGSIESVVIRRLRLSLLSGTKRRVTIEADTKNNPKAVYDVMDRLRLPPFHVTQAEITATFTTPAPGTRTKTRTFTISYPDLCNLRHEGWDGMLRQMLAASGIDLVEQETVGAVGTV